MTETTFSLVRDYEIKCKLFAPEDGDVNQVIVGVHGFAGDKDSSMLKRLANACENTALLCFDFPAHGKSPALEESFTIRNCKDDLLFVCDYVQVNYPKATKSVFATSFGGYIMLHCLDELSDFIPVLRAPAITMADILVDNVLKIKPSDFSKAGHVICGFERKIDLPYRFYTEMKEAPTLLREFPKKEMLIIHGDLDDIVPPSVIYEFAEKNPSVTLKIIEGADHRFKRSGELETVIRYTKEYLNI